MKTNSTKQGYQPKEYLANSDCYLKYDKTRGSAVAEVLVSIFLESCYNAVPFVTYRLYYGRQNVCVSKNFLERGEYFIPFYEILKHSREDFSGLSFTEKLDKLVRLFEGTLGLDVRRFLHQMIYLDMMFRNEDRHLTNFGFIGGLSGDLRVCPIFDNGEAFDLGKGLYWDYDNVVKGWGVTLKPLECSIREVEASLNNPFHFNCKVYSELLKQSNISFNDPLLRVSLALVSKYFPTDFNGVNTKDYLERIFGRIKLV